MGKIIFLGTAGDSIVAGKQIRATGGIIVQTEKIQLHIDPGPGAIVKAIENGINPRANTAILVSNNYLINCNDVNAVVDAMTYCGEDSNGVLAGNQTVINGADDTRPYLTELYKSFLEKVMVLSKGQKIGIEDIEIHAMPAINSDPNAIGFKIFTNEFVLGYSSETKYSKDIAKEYKGCDILVLKVLVPAGNKVEYALNSENAAKFIKIVNPSLVIITGFGIGMIKADPLYEGRELQKETGVQVLTAKDGMVITPDSYAAKSKQKRLHLLEENSIKETLPDKQENDDPDEDHQEQLEF